MTQDFLKDFVTYGKGSEAPDSYKLFGGVAALSSMIGRKCWVEMGMFDIYPNLYVVFVGPAGMRKTSGMDMALECLQDVGGVPLSAEATTKEKLVEDMTEQQVKFDLDPKYLKRNNNMQAPMTCMVTELSQFLGANSGHMIDFLTTVYDRRKYESKTRHKGSFEIEGPFLNVLACTTPDWITFYMKTDVISGGFSRRTLFIYESTRSEKIPFPEISVQSQEAWNRCIAYGKKLKQQLKAGPMIWSEEAKEYYSTWYKGMPTPTEEWQARYYESKHVQMLKIATILSLSQDFSKNLKLPHIKRAIELLDDIEVKMGRVFEGLGRNELSALATKAMDLILRSPKQEIRVESWTQNKTFKHGITERVLRAQLFANGKRQEIDETIDHLIGANKIQRFKDVNKNPHKLWIVSNE